MSAFKDELVSIFPKSTNTKTSLSKMDRVFMIILLLNLKSDFENIREQILTGAVIPLMRLLLGYFAIPPLPLRLMRSDTSVMFSQFHSRSDSRGGRGSNRGRG